MSHDSLFYPTKCMVLFSLHHYDMSLKNMQLLKSFPELGHMPL